MIAWSSITKAANHPTPVDHTYEHLRVGIRDLFTALGIAAQDRQFFFHPFQ
jgi:hypothetical protein